MDRALKAGWRFVPATAFIQELGKPAWDGQRRLSLLMAQPREGTVNGHPAKAQVRVALHP